MPTTERAVVDPGLRWWLDGASTGVVGRMGRAPGCGWRVVGFGFGFVSCL